MAGGTAPSRFLFSMRVSEMVSFSLFSLGSRIERDFLTGCVYTVDVSQEVVALLVALL